MPRWPIGAHWTQHAYDEALDLGLAFTWLNADGFTDDPRSVALADVDGCLASGLRFVLTFALSSEDRLHNTGGCWTTHVAQVRDRLIARGALDRCLAPQLDDEWYTNRRYHGHDIGADSVHVAARAEDVRRIFGAAVGAGVGMAETGSVLPPTIGIDWWGLNVYWAWGYHDRAKVIALYADAARLGKPVMPILPLFADAPWPPMPLDQLASLLPAPARAARDVHLVRGRVLPAPSKHLGPGVACGRARHPRAGAGLSGGGARAHGDVRRLDPAVRVKCARLRACWTMR